MKNVVIRTDYKCYTLEDAIAVCNANNWKIEAVGDFYKVV